MSQRVREEELRQKTELVNQVAKVVKDKTRDQLMAMDANQLRAEQARAEQEVLLQKMRTLERKNDHLDHLHRRLCQPLPSLSAYLV